MVLSDTIKKLKAEVDALGARVTVSDESVRHLTALYCAIYEEACFDPFNEGTRKFATGLLPHIMALNDELKFKR